MASKIPSLFVFQRRGRAVNLSDDQKIQNSTDGIQRAMTAPLKNKKRGLVGIVRAINRPPLRGLEQSAPTKLSISFSQTWLAKMWGMTRSLIRFTVPVEYAHTFFWCRRADGR